jgi:hypothetical protein
MFGAFDLRHRHATRWVGADDPKASRSNVTNIPNRNRKRPT